MKKYSFHSSRISAAISGLALLMVTTHAQTSTIPLELGLAIDDSSSITNPNFDLQIDAYLNVLNDPNVIPQDGSVAIGLSVFAFSARLVFPTTVIDPTSILDLTDTLTALERNSAGATNIGAPIDTLTDDIFGNVIDSQRQIIDVSTDGAGSLGTSVEDALTAGIDQINCLGIGANANCSFIAGDGAFDIAAVDFDAFEQALSNKIMLEIGGGGPTPVPIPGALALFSLTLVSLGFFGRRTRKHILSGNTYHPA